MKFVTVLMVALMTTAATGADSGYSASYASNKSFIEKTVRVPVVIQNLGRDDADETVFE